LKILFIAVTITLSLCLFGTALNAAEKPNILWWIERSAFTVTAVQEIVAEFMGTFKEFPPRQKPAKFNVDDVMKTMYKTGYD